MLAVPAMSHTGTFGEIGWVGGEGLYGRNVAFIFGNFTKFLYILGQANDEICKQISMFTL